MASELETLSNIEQSGNLNPVQRTRLQELRSHGNDLGNLEGIESPGQFSGTGAGYGGNPGDNLITSTINAYTKKLADYNTRYSEYTKNNPFVFDKVLQEERDKVKQRLDPYYTQTLDDYLKGINFKRTRSLEDERTVLSQLSADKDRYAGQQQAQLQDALEQTGQGYANAGLYDSGARGRSQGQQQAQTNQDIANYNIENQRQAYRTQLETKRYVGQDIPLQQSQFQRNLAQEQTYNTEAQALPQAQQRQSQYEFARQQYAGTPPGANPLDFQNSLYSTLGK